MVCPPNPLLAGNQSFSAQIWLCSSLAAESFRVAATSITVGPMTPAEVNNNPLLVRVTTRVRDFQLDAQTETDVEGFYIQDDWRVTKNLQFNIGARWDYQQARGNEGVTYLKLNNWFDNLQPRLGFIWDFTGKGKGKIFANYARFLETPIPLDINVRAGSERQPDRQEL